jgi:NAD+ synthase (glutamine-hydrolysing)
MALQAAVFYGQALQEATLEKKQLEAWLQNTGASGVQALLNCIWQAEPTHNNAASLLFTALQLYFSSQNLSGLWALGQLNPAAGHVEGNAQQIYKAMTAAKSLNLQGLVLPELSLLGYPIRDVITRFPVLVEVQLTWLNWLISQSGDCLSVVGFAEPRWQTLAGKEPAKKGRPYYNSLALMANGKLLGLVRKQLLPTYAEYEDWRTFEPAPCAGIYPPEAFCLASFNETQVSPVLNWQGERLAFTICEDIWNAPAVFAQQLYTENPVLSLMEAKPTLWVNASASVARLGKEAAKAQLLSYWATLTQAPWLACNQAGAIDECCFDGASRLVWPKTEPKTEQKEEQHSPVIGLHYESQLLLVASKHPAWHGGSHSVSAPAPKTLLDSFSSLSHLGERDSSFQASVTGAFSRQKEEVRETCPVWQEASAWLYPHLVTGLANYFKKTGFKRACLGLSGGLDSAVVAVLLADALGPENVLAFSFPTHITPQSNKNDAETLAKNLGIGWAEIPINPIVEAFLKQGLAPQRSTLNAWWGEASAFSFAQDNVQAMSRATLLRLVGNDYQALPVATSDKSEFYMGYTTVNGDMSGALAPLGDVTKTRVRQLAYWMNAHRKQANAIPTEVITRPSGADLALDPATGQTLTAESVLMPYTFADEIIWRIEALKQGREEMKRQTFFYEQKVEPLSQAQKEEWIDRFFSRMSKAIFKWWLAPPVLLCDSAGSLAKTEYHHPLTACKLNWQAPSLAFLMALEKQGSP